MRRGIFLAGVLLAMFAIPSTAFAWHPHGVITKEVRNVATNGVYVDANDAASAVTAYPGNTLQYRVTIRNVAPDTGSNDMASTVMTDELPTGVTLVSNPQQRVIDENIGLLEASGRPFIKEYAVRVVTGFSGAINNIACFEGQTTNGEEDHAQHGCDNAVVKVPFIPPPTPKPPTPVPPAPPAPPVAQPKPGPRPCHRPVQTKRYAIKVFNLDPPGDIRPETTLSTAGRRCAARKAQLRLKVSPKVAPAVGTIRFCVTGRSAKRVKSVKFFLDGQLRKTDKHRRFCWKARTNRLARSGHPLYGWHRLAVRVRYRG